jgi:putative PIN family toxin of toxin-antitoxin system
VSSERVVLDTNVVVPALLNSFGAPGRVLDLVLTGELTVVHDDRVLVEWRRVLTREKFGFSATDVEALLGFVGEEGLGVNPSPLGADLPDQDDVVFLEVARTAVATLITGNTKHFPPEKRQGVVVLDPAAFLDEWISNTRKQESASRPESTGDGPATSDGQ